MSPEKTKLLEKRRRFWSRVKRLSIIGILVPPLFGLSDTVIGMIRTFNEVNRGGTADSESLSNSISAALLKTSQGVTVSLVAGCIFLLALNRLSAPRRPFASNGGQMAGDRTKEALLPVCLRRGE